MPSSELALAHRLLHLIAPAVVAVATMVIPAAGQRQDTVIRNAGAPRYPGISTLVQEQSIGAVNGPDAYALGNITELAVGRDGSIYALDRSAFTIRVYDATGRHVRNIGRKGEGPGDLSSPSGLAVLRDGRILVWDTQLWRMTVFSPSGATVGQWPARATAGSASAGSRGLVLDSSDFAYGRRLTIEVNPVGVSSGAAVRTGADMQTRTVWLKFRTSDGAVIDSIVEPRMPPFSEPLRATESRGWRQMAMPFAPKRLTALSPLGYVVSGIAERYAFEIRPAGRVTSVRRDVVPTAVPARERDSSRAHIEKMMKEVDPLWTWGGRDLPRTMPYFVDIRVGLDGRIWLQRDQSQPPVVPAQRQPGRSGAGAAVTPDPNVDYVYKPTHFDVFEPSGAFIGQVEMPPKVTPMVMRGDLVWAIAKDDDDVQFVRRYRIVWK